MKKLLTPVLAVCAAMSIQAQTPETFMPYKATDLRLPSVPVVVSDPYFSIWSPYDQLTDGSTRHWTSAEKPLQGLLRVDGVTYRFLGEPLSVLETIMPMAAEKVWTAPYTNETPAAGWEKPGFDDKSWKRGEGAFGSDGLNDVHTRWNDENSDLYVRREFNLDSKDLDEELVLKYSHDDVFEIYINGVLAAKAGETWRNGVEVPLSADIKKHLRPGKNVIAAHCHNTTGGAFTDFGLYRKKMGVDKNVKVAEQKSVDVLATSSYYTFACGPMELDVVFTAPMLIDNYDLLSSPINYISYRVRSTDGKKHDVQMMLTASPKIATNNEHQATITEMVTEHGIRYAKTGTIEQPILAKSGDHICIDWGHLYVPAINGTVGIGSDDMLKKAFMSNGIIPTTPNNQEIISSKADDTIISYVHDFGNTADAASYTLIGYDEIKDIEYFFKQYQAYWAHGGEVSIFDMFDTLNSSYSSIMKRCKDFDKMIYDDAFEVGGKKYAEILSGSYRHVIAAHKLFKDDKGNLLFFSKENDSNGCVNTVDLTYPEAPLFLIYNPELQKAMMTSIMDYSQSGRWTKPFAAHDLGQYPLANGQVYGGDMPLEEAGNMLTLIAMCSKIDGNTSYADRYWDILQIWADYLSENGQDPENQLCTDDFAGHWAHNANLSAKAIMGIAGFAEMARMKGDDATARKYNDRAREMAKVWVEKAREGKKGDVHYRLAFDRPDTWSQKYNMIWDQLWDTDIFPDEVMDTEIAYYLKKQNKYGLPLDNRKDYTKSDWIMWTAAMSPDTKTLMKFINPLYDYINETPTRVAISDWYDTKTGEKTGFMARSVIAGHWMPMLAEKMKK